MVSSDILNIGSEPVADNRITKIEFHTYNPYVNTTLKNNDEIRICVQQQDLYLLPSESYIYVEVSLAHTNGPASTNDVNMLDAVYLDNNCIAFMFDEIRYELNGVEIDRCKNPGITTTIKNYLTLSPEESRALDNAGWRCVPDAASFQKRGDRKAPLKISFCVPLKKILGYCADYTKISANTRNELILTRARTDVNALYGSSGATYDLTLDKVQWRIPHVTMDDMHKLTMLRALESGRSITMNFRSWEIQEYPLLQTTTRHTWAVKATTQMEKPRYVIFALQTARKNDIAARASIFDHCNLSNVCLYLNSERYPYDDLNIDFKNNRYAVLYDMLSKFRESYYGSGGPLLDITEFMEYGPFVVLDCSRQNESVKSATVDVRIDFECRENVPPDTTAYCIIVHDRIVDYNPLTNIVRKII